MLIARRACELFRFRCVEQFGDVDFQGIGNFGKDQCGRISGASLDAANIPTIKATVGREIFLRDVLRFTQASQIPSYACANIHRLQRSSYETDLPTTYKSHFFWTW